jgi:hypothetical protein
MPITLWSPALTKTTGRDGRSIGSSTTPATSQSIASLTVRSTQNFLSFSGGPYVARAPSSTRPATNTLWKQPHAAIVS